MTDGPAWSSMRVMDIKAGPRAPKLVLSAGDRTCCRNPRCKRRFTMSRDWQVFCSDKCRLSTHAREMREAIDAFRKAHAS